MSRKMPVSVPLGRYAGSAQLSDSLATRIRMVLETRPGQVPWRPDFGCDLNSLVGEPATAQRLGEAKWRITKALRRWLPEVDVVKCTVRMVTTVGSDGRRDRLLPIAESALVRFGTQGSLEVQLDLLTAEGPVSVEATISN